MVKQGIKMPADMPVLKYAMPYIHRLTIQKGTKYESSDSGSKTLKNSVFHIY